jgi:hypothetical protein
MPRSCLYHICSGRWPPLTRPSLPHTTHTTRHSFGFANLLTPTWPSNDLPVSPIDVRCSAHIRMLAAPSLPLFLTDLEPTLAPFSHTTHTTRHNFGYRNTLTATKLPACIHCRCSSKRAHPIGAAHLRSLLLKDLRCSTLVPRTRTRHTRLYLRLSL